MSLVTVHVFPSNYFNHIVLIWVEFGRFERGKIFLLGKHDLSPWFISIIVLDSYTTHFRFYIFICYCTRIYAVSRTSIRCVYWSVRSFFGLWLFDFNHFSDERFIQITKSWMDAASSSQFLKLQKKQECDKLKEICQPLILFLIDIFICVDCRFLIDDVDHELNLGFYSIRILFVDNIVNGCIIETKRKPRSTNVWKSIQVVNQHFPLFYFFF